MNIENSKLARSLFSKTSKLEQDLAQLLKKKSPVDRSITQLRDQIRDNYEQVLFLDLVFAQSKDIDQLLWKCVFYKAIEEFRKIIQKYQKASSTSTGKEQETAKEKLSKITTAFLAFLADASKYYESLFERLFKKYEECKAEPEMCAIYVPILQKMYITLGDLARYAQLHSENQAKDWSYAIAYYTKALNFNPANGNSHNQLAVIATYKNDDFEGCYRYFRSLAVKKPFLSARENLILLFERNRQKHVKLTQKLLQNNEKLSAASSGHGRHHNRTPKKKMMFKEVPRATNEEVFERMLVEFVRLHGIIFTRINVETFDSVKKSAFSDLQHLLNNNNYNSSKTSALITDDLLLKMTIMNIFSLDHGLQQQDAVILQNAVSLVFDMYIALCEAATRLTQVSSGAIVAALSILLQYIKSDNAQALKAQLGLDNIWTNTATLANKLIKQSMDINVNNDETIEKNSMMHLRLPEDVELKGFKPLIEKEHLAELANSEEDAPKELLYMCRVNRFMRIVKAAAVSNSNGIRLDVQRAAFYATTSVSSSAQFIAHHIPLEEEEEIEEDEDENNNEYKSNGNNQYEFVEEPVANGHSYTPNKSNNGFIKASPSIEEEDVNGNDDDENNENGDDEGDDEDDGEVFMFDKKFDNNRANAWHAPVENHTSATSSLFSNSFFGAPSAFGAFNSPWGPTSTAASTPNNSKVIERPRSDSNPIAPQNAFSSWGSPQPQQNYANNAMSHQFVNGGNASASNSFGSFGMFNEDAKWSAGSPQKQPSNGTPIGHNNKRAFIS